MYGYIYKTTNLVNGKIYIGQKKSNKFLGKDYLGSGKILKKAIDKYNKDNFKVELLEKCDSTDILNKQEKYWISYFNSTDKEVGYNIAEGGHGGISSLDYIWINNGVVEYTIYKNDLIPKGFIKGRLPFTDTHKLNMKNVDRYWVRGDKNPMKDPKIRELRSTDMKGKNTWTIDSFWINNGIKELLIHCDGTIPVGYTKGRLPEKGETKIKISNKFKNRLSPTKGRRWVNNGSINKSMLPEELDSFINNGWVLGRLGNFVAWNKGKHKA